jgi:hypothetical protein
MSDVDLPTLKKLIGHKNISMTLRYSHLSSDHNRNAVEKLEKFGMNSHQFAQQAGNSEVGNPHNPLILNLAPLAQMDRAPDF